MFVASAAPPSPITPISNPYATRRSYESPFTFIHPRTDFLLLDVRIRPSGRGPGSTEFPSREYGCSASLARPVPGKISRARVVQS